MRILTFCMMVVFMLVSVNTIWADVSTVVNGGFEDDGKIDDLASEDPNGWNVNIPSTKFKGSVDNYWASEGIYSLTLYTDKGTFTADDVNDIAYVYQYVTLRDVNAIIFDLHLDSVGAPWDSTKRTALVMLDDVVIWDSNGVTPEDPVSHTLDINDVEDFSLYKLAFGLRIDAEGTTSTYYYTDWDDIRFELHCDGNGFPHGDINRDCCVDFNDYALLANLWMEHVDPNSKYNLVYDVNGIINFRDFALLADIRDGNDLSDIDYFTAIWLDEVEVSHDWNLYKGDDYGIIDFADLAAFLEDWLKNSYD